MCTCTAGDAVIVTASLGVLKRGGIQFSPALPERKLGAIKRLGFGVLNKVRFLIQPRSAAFNAISCCHFASIVLWWDLLLQFTPNSALSVGTSRLHET